MEASGFIVGRYQLLLLPMFWWNRSRGWKSAVMKDMSRVWRGSSVP